MSVPGWWLPTVSRRTDREWRLAAVVFLIAVVLVGFAGPAGEALAATNDTADDEPPRLTSGTRYNDTTVQLLVTDNEDVNESSIDVGDFVHEAGSPTAINVTENGSNATVRLSLGQRVDEENLTVAIAHSGEIRDEAGNALTVSADASAVVARGMDSIPPTVRTYDVEAERGGPVTLSIQASEPLAGVNVSVYGPVDDHLGMEAFSATDQAYTYEATYTPAEDGTVTFELVNVTDTGGNTGAVAIRAEAFVDTTPPDARAGIDVGASTNRTLTFDGGRSTDANDIASYAWDFGDGTTATGERVTHAFDPGNYTIELVVTDEYGNAGTDTLVVNLSGTNETTTATDRSEELRVSIREENASGAGFVEFEHATRGAPITVAALDRPLVAGEGFALDRLNLTLAVNGSGTVGLSTAGTTTVAAAASATETEPLGGFNAIHSLSESDVENVTFAFSVDTERLEAMGATPDNVTLVRETNGEWSPLPTTRAAVANGTARYSAESPGFSAFAIVADPPTESASDDPEQAAGPTPTPTPTETVTMTATPTPTETATEPPESADRRQFAVTNVTLNPATVQPGETVRINATVENRGNTSGGYTAGLVVNGTVVETDLVGLHPGNSTVAEFTYRTNETGTYDVIVNGTMADRELTVGASGGGGLLGSVLGVFGFLPLGLVGTALQFVVLPLAVVYLALKALAYYLGY